MASRAGSLLLGTVLLTGVVAACSSEPDTDGSTPEQPVQSSADCGRLKSPCEVGGPCEGAPDCASGACRDATCVGVAPPDNTQNNDETDVDCGGSSAPACDDGKKCMVAADCKSGVCTGGTCQAPSPTDGVKNGDETGLDCGGAKAPKCAQGQGCVGDADCDKAKCDSTSKKCLGPTYDDGIKNGDETGVDCGGPTTPKKCPTGEGCAATSDCDNVLCNVATMVCSPPANDDGLKNGNESAVDCGSSGTGTNTNAPRCDAGLACAAANDCKSGGCNHKGVCAFARSCTVQHGGTTCGTGDATAAANQNEDCCASEIVPTYNTDGYNNTLAAFRLDKYQITAGRIRTFLTAVNGNVKKWVEDNRAAVFDPSQLPTALDKFLPAGFTQADSADDCDPDDPLGSPPNGNEIKCNYGALNQISGYRYNNQPGGDNGYGCYVTPGGYSTRTYYTTAAENTQIGIGESLMAVSKDRADEKSMTCVTYFILAAFCAWDGGKLETYGEYNAAYGGNGTTGRTYPWGSEAASRPMGFADLFSPVVMPTTKNPNAGDNYSVFDALTAEQRATTLARLDRANLSWNYFDAQILDYRAPLQVRAQVQITAENTINVANDSSVAVAPPGRYPQGAGAYGHRDLLGNVMEITATAATTNRKWSRNGSFETSHFVAPAMTGVSVYNFNHLTKYGRTGGRCARPVGVYPAAPLP